MLTGLSREVGPENSYDPNAEIDDRSPIDVPPNCLYRPFTLRMEQCHDDDDRQHDQVDNLSHRNRLPSSRY